MVDAPELNNIDFFLCYSGKCTLLNIKKLKQKIGKRWNKNYFIELSQTVKLHLLNYSYLLDKWRNRCASFWWTCAPWRSFPPKNRWESSWGLHMRYASNLEIMFPICETLTLQTSSNCTISLNSKVFRHFLHTHGCI